MVDGIIARKVETEEPSVMSGSSQQFLSELQTDGSEGLGRFDQLSNSASALPDLQIADARVVKLPREEPPRNLLWAETTRGVAPGAARGPKSYETGAPVREI